MEPLDRLETPASSLETVALNGFQAPTVDNGQKDSSPAEILRFFHNSHL